MAQEGREILCILMDQIPKTSGVWGKCWSVEGSGSPISFLRKHLQHLDPRESLGLG